MLETKMDLTLNIQRQRGLRRRQHSLRSTSSLFLAAAVWSYSAMTCCFSQESFSQNGAASNSQTTETTDDAQNGLEISYGVMLRLIGADREFGLTREQSDEHQKIVQQRSEADLRLSVLRYYATYPQPRILQAMQFANRQLDQEAARDMLECLTPEQRAAVRQKFRDEIESDWQREQGRPPQVSTYNRSESPARAILGNDLVWAMQYPWLLERLDLFDDQPSQIRQIATDADMELLKVVRQCAETGPLPNIDTVSFSLQPSKTLTDEMNQILTTEQQELYKKYCEDRSKRLDEMIAADPQNAGMNILRMQPFGTISCVSSDEHGDSYTLSNDFLRVETRLATNVTPEQVERLSKCLAAAELSMAKISKDHRESQKAQMRAAAAELRPLIDEHLATKSQQIRKLLSDDQLEVLEDEKFRGLGFEALKEEELQEILELSEQQVQDLTTILNRQPEGLKSTIMRPLMFTQDLSHEEQRAKMEASQKELAAVTKENARITREYMRKQQADVTAVLTHDQHEKFLSLTLD